MYERCLNEAERILAVEKDVIAPVKKVWKEVEKQGHRQGFEVPTLADFSAMLEGDSRFEFVPTHNFGEEPLEEGERDDSIEEAELETLGFYAGDRVKLRSVELTPEIIGDLIRRKVDLTMTALTKAWEARPQGDQEAEDQLLEILAKTQKLQREVKKTFSEERMKELSQAIAQAPDVKPSPKRAAKSRRKRKPPLKKVMPKKPIKPTRAKRSRKK